MAKKFITNLNSSNASGPDCVPVVSLKNFEPELSYWLNSSICVRKSFVFQMVGGSCQWSLYLRMLGKGLLLKVFEKLLNNRIVNQVE